MNRFYKQQQAIIERLREESEDDDPLTAASASIALEHFEDFDCSQKSHLNTTARYLFFAPFTEAGAMILRIYGMLGWIPKSFRGDKMVCDKCNKELPLKDRLFHGSRCKRIGKTERHDCIRNLLVTRMRSAVGMSNVKGETPFELTDNAAATPTEVPDQIKGQRSDASFYTEQGDWYHLDISVCCGGREDRFKRERTKTDKYEVLRTYSKPFSFIPFVVSARGTMQRQAETFARYLSEHEQVGLTGSWSVARVQQFLGTIQAIAMQRELAMLMRVLGLPSNGSRDPALIFSNGVIPSTTSTNIVERRNTHRSQEAKLVAEAGEHTERARPAPKPPNFDDYADAISDGNEGDADAQPQHAGEPEEQC